MKRYFFVVSALTWCLIWFLIGLLGFMTGAYFGLRIIATLRASNPYFTVPAILATLGAVYLVHLWAKHRLFHGEPVVEACPGRRCCAKSRLSEIREREANE